MKKAHLILPLMMGILTLTNCSKKGTGSMATKATTPEAKVAEVKKKYTAAQMEEGKTIWEASCTKCHSLIAPEGHSVEAWERILPRMVKRAKLTDEQSGKVRAYILANTTRMDKDEKPGSDK